jgi:tetratricopeptide (TPR) repeat protein
LTQAARRSRRRENDASAELRALAGPRAKRAVEQLDAATDAFLAGREKEAARTLRPLTEQYPQAAGVRELRGLALYRSGSYAAAGKELEAFVQLTRSFDQHPILMDCARAQRRYRRVDDLWEELKAASPSAAIVTEGRIVAAGALADQGRLREAIALLDKRGGDLRHAQEHHLRLWYALADLTERAGDLPRARALFEQVRRHDPGFADVAERLAALG